MGSTNYFNQVEINITHTYVEDLVIALFAPNGTTVLLSSGNGGNGNDYINTVFRDDAPTYIVSGDAPFTGSFIPEGFFSVFDGINADGIWTLKICDGADVDDGTLDSWGITFDDVEILSDCATNPISPAPLCNAFKLIVVLDESGSIDVGPNGATNELAEEATLSLVEVLIGTGAQVSLIEFGSMSSITSLPSCPSEYHTVTQSYYDELEAYITSGYSPSGLTNWEGALQDI